MSFTHNNIMDRKTIEETPKIKLVDSDAETGIDLFCYTHCDKSDPDIIKRCRGIVFKGDEKILEGFPFTQEYSERDYEFIISNNILDGGDSSTSFNNCKVYDAYEGSTIRIFHYSGKWFISTNRKLDAFRSKWASKESYGTFFKKALEFEYEQNEEFRTALSSSSEEDIIQKFFSILDVNKQYMFLLLNNEENRIVSLPPEQPTVYHVGTFVDGILSMEENVYLPYPREHVFESIVDMFDYVHNISWKNKQGIIIFTPDNNQIKILNEEYKELFEARGNEPSIKFRYLQVRLDAEYSSILRYLYPDFVKSFEEYENHLKTVANNIYNAYVSRFIKKNYVKVSQDEYNVIRECHSWHLEDRYTNFVNLNKVTDVLNAQSPTNLNNMIKNLKKLNYASSAAAPPIRHRHVSLLNKNVIIDRS